MLALGAFSLGAPTKHKKGEHALKPDGSLLNLAGYDKQVGGYGYCCLKAGATIPYGVDDCSDTGNDCRMQHDLPGCISYAGQCAVMKKDLKDWCDNMDGCGGGFCGSGYPNEGTDEHYCLMRGSEEMSLDSSSLNSAVAPTAITYTKHAAPPPPFGPVNMDGIPCSGTSEPVAQFKYDQMKCNLGADRLFREEGHTLASCTEKCYKMHGQGCNYFSFKPAAGEYSGVCMGCGSDSSIVSHDGFDLYVVHPPCDPPAPPLSPFPLTPPPSSPPLPSCDCSAATLRNSETCETFGDPHQRTFSGIAFDFMAAGLYTLAKGTTECGCDIDVQSYQMVHPNHPNAAFNIAIAIKAGPSLYMIKSNLMLTTVIDGVESVHAPLEVPETGQRMGDFIVQRFSTVRGSRSAIGYKFMMPGVWNTGAKVIVTRWEPLAGWFADMYQDALPDGYFLSAWVAMPEVYASSATGLCVKKCTEAPAMPNEECGDDACLPVYTEDAVFTDKFLGSLENFTGTGASTRNSKDLCAKKEDPGWICDDDGCREKPVCGPDSDRTSGPCALSCPEVSKTGTGYVYDPATTFVKLSETGKSAADCASWCADMAVNDCAVKAALMLSDVELYCEHNGTIGACSAIASKNPAVSQTVDIDISTGDGPCSVDTYTLSACEATPLEACNTAMVDFGLASEKCDGVTSFAACVYDFCSTGGDESMVEETDFVDDVDEGIRTSPPPMAPPVYPPAAPLPPLADSEGGGSEGGGSTDGGFPDSINIHGDPMFKSNGTGTHFWVKEGTLTPLLTWHSAKGKKIELSGRTITHHKSDYQWFKQLVLTQDGKAVVDMVAHDPGAKRNNALQGDPFKVTRGEAQLESNSLVKITTEKVEVEINGLHFVVQPSEARKFTTVQERQHYEHLNLHFDRGIPGGLGAAGILAELAGIQPMSASTKAMLLRPHSTGVMHPKSKDAKAGAKAGAKAEAKAEAKAAATAKASAKLAAKASAKADAKADAKHWHRWYAEHAKSADA